MRACLCAPRMRSAAPRPVGARHLDVHEQHVGPFALEQLDRLVAVGAERAHLHVVLRFEDGLQRHPHERVVVDDKRPDHAFSFDGSFGMVANTRKPLR